MPSVVATGIYIVLIIGLFALDGDRKARTSAALWIPVVWLSVVCSRSVSTWLGMGVPSESPDQVLNGSPIDRLFYSVLLALGILVLIGRQTQLARLLRANVPLLAFFFYCGVSILWSDYPDIAVKRWIRAIGDARRVQEA